MKNYDYWKDFVSTGRIDDYLHYIACTKEDETDEFMQAADGSIRNMGFCAPCMDGSIQSMNISARSAVRNKEGGFHAGINYCDGDGSIGHASW